MEIDNLILWLNKIGIQKCILDEEKGAYLSPKRNSHYVVQEHTADSLLGDCTLVHLQLYPLFPYSLKSEELRVHFVAVEGLIIASSCSWDIEENPFHRDLTGFGLINSAEDLNRYLHDCANQLKAHLADLKIEESRYE